MKIAILGLGEAGSHFANDLAEMGITVSGADPNLKRELHPKISFSTDNVTAVKNADIVFSVNYTSESKGIAKEVLPSLKIDALYCEMNTSSPATKLEIETILKPANIHFVDLAIMAPVPPKGIKVPLLASGGGANLLVKKMTPYNLDLTVLSKKNRRCSRSKIIAFNSL